MSHAYVKIFDTTLRDGEQAPGNSMNLHEKLRFARQLERLGVDVIEAGFPIASPDDFRAVEAIAGVCESAEVCALSRALEKDILCAWDAIKHARKPRIHTFVATSPLHMEYKLRKTPTQVLQMAIDGVRRAKSLCDRVDFSPEDATRSDPAFLYEVLAAAIEAGADTLNIPDTVGYSSPEEFAQLIRGILENVPGAKNVIISTHCHDDLGLAVANSLAGVLNGARQIECTINGIGERAGNASLEEVVMALVTRRDIYGVRTGVNTRELYPTSTLLTSITGVAVQPNKAIVGANAFAHEAGIHQDGILKERRTYEIMRAEDIGRQSNSIVLGKHSGRHALRNRFEQLGYALTAEQLETMYDNFVRLADKKKKIYDEDLILLLQQHRDGIAKEYVLRELTVTAGTTVAPLAYVTVEDPHGVLHRAEGSGDGPIASVFQAIDAVVGCPVTLVEYSVHALTEGDDAQGTVAVQIRLKDQRIVSGSGSDTDIIVASVQAYLSALNRALLLQKAVRLSGEAI